MGPGMLRGCVQRHRGACAWLSKTGQPLSSSDSAFIAGKACSCVSPAFPVWPQVRLCSAVEGGEKLPCVHGVWGRHTTGAWQTLSWKLLWQRLLLNAMSHLLQSWSPDLYSAALCFPVFKSFLILDYCFLIGAVTDTGPVVNTSPDGPRNFLVTCLGFEACSGDWGFHLMETLWGFLRWVTRGPARWLLERTSVLSGLGTGAALLEGGRGDTQECWRYWAPALGGHWVRLCGRESSE